MESLLVRKEREKSWVKIMDITCNIEVAAASTDYLILASGSLAARQHPRREAQLQLHKPTSSLNLSVPASPSTPTPKHHCLSDRNPEELLHPQLISNITNQQRWITARKLGVVYVDLHLPGPVQLLLRLGSPSRSAIC